MTSAPVPSDAVTIAAGGAAQRRRGHLPWWFPPVLAAAAFAGTVVWSGSFPGIPYVGVGLASLLVCTIVVLWSLSFEWEVTIARRVAVGVIVVALAVGSVAIAVEGVPLRVRFALSAAEFEAVVAEAEAQFDRSEAGATADPDDQGFPIACPTAIGQFKIAGCQAWVAEQPSGGGVGHVYSFHQSRSALGDTSAITYLPDGPISWNWEPPTHLRGPWYGATCGC